MVRKQDSLIDGVEKGISTRDRWKRYIEDFDEGLGTVYERILLNDILRRLRKQYRIRKVLEAPLYGITGVPGINSTELVRNGCELTLVDNNRERTKEVKKLWRSFGLQSKVNLCFVRDFSSLPFRDNSFDFVWNFAALWHVREAPKLIAEMARVSSDLVFVIIQNHRQIGYYLRKYFLDRELFKQVYEEWLDTITIKKMLEENNMEVIESGYFDIPPFPDFAMPMRDVLGKIGLQRSKNCATHKRWWIWSIIEHYRGQNPELPEKIKMLTFIENLSLPQGLKNRIAHLRYVLGRIKNV